jgi:hypothetical protein
MAFSLAARWVSSLRVASRDSEVDEESDEATGIEEEEKVSTGLLAAEEFGFGSEGARARSGDEGRKGGGIHDWGMQERM